MSRRNTRNPACNSGGICSLHIPLSDMSEWVRLMQRSKQHLYSIISSASASSTGGIPKPIAFAVLRLMSEHSFCRRTRPAQGTQRLAPFVRNGRYRIDRRPRLMRKEWVRPGLSCEPPAEHPAEQEPQKDQLGRVGRRFTHSVLAESCAPRRAKDVIRLWCIKGLHEHADERKGRRARVAEGRVAAFRVPAIEPLGRQPQSFDLVLPLGEAQRSGRDLNAVAAAPVIEEIGAADLMRIGLAVIAIADHAIDRPGRRIGDDAANLPATATHLNLSAHEETSATAATSLSSASNSCLSAYGTWRIPTRHFCIPSLN